MKQGEKGFNTIELLVALAIIALIGSAAAKTIFQTISVTGQSSSHIIAVRQVQNGGYWISHDAQMAENAVVDNLEPPNFLILTWTEQNYEGGKQIHHSVTYFFEDLSGAVGNLKRNHWSTAGANEQTLVAKHIYYDPNDPDNTTKATYTSPVLTVKLTAVFEDATETKEYQVQHRKNF